MSGKHPTEDQLAQARPFPETFPALTEAGRQAQRVNESAAGDPDLARFLDAALADLMTSLDQRKG